MSRTPIATLLFLSLAAGPTAAPADDGEEPVKLPVTLERVWYRTGSESGFGKVFKSPGDLTITREGLEFVAGKKTLWFPMEQIRHVTFGKMKGDVDTDWAILATGETTATQIVGFRDGSKLGYGGRTGEIFETLKRIAKEIGAAQYSVPPGFEPFEGMESQAFMAIPRGWDPYLESLSVGEGRRPWEMIVVSSEPIPRGEAGTAVLRRIREGEVPAFFVERSEARRGMECDGLSRGSRKEIERRVCRHPLLDREYEKVGEAVVEPTTVGGCDGVRIVTRGRKPDGGEIVVDAVGVAHGDTLFLFGVRSLPENHSQSRDSIDAVIDTVQFSLAR